MTDPSPAAERFWSLVGFEERFPRTLESSVSLALPVAIVRLHSLTPGRIDAWLAGSGIPIRLPSLERALKGCLLAHRGHAFVFLDHAQPADETRITLAHETAHFLLHYAWPRELAIQYLGQSIRTVLDGERRATAAERLSGLLRGIPLGSQCHLLDRDTVGGLIDQKTERCEVEADLLGFELLAPARTLLKVGRDARERALVDRFGLPLWAAKAWSGWINGRRTRRGFIEGLREAAKNK